MRDRGVEGLRGRPGAARSGRSHEPAGVRCRRRVATRPRAHLELHHRVSRRAPRARAPTSTAPPPSAITRPAARPSSSQHDLLLARAEGGLALAVEEGLDRLAEAPLQLASVSSGSHPQRGRDRARGGGLARAHEADEDDRAAGRRRTAPALRASIRSAPRRRASAASTSSMWSPPNFSPVGRGQHQRHHRLAHHARRGHGAGVGALAQRLRGLLRGDVDRAQRLGERRQRLHGAAHDQRVAGGHAALHAAGAVGLAEVAALLGPEDLVVGLRARRARRGRSRRRSPTPFIAWIDMIACARRPSRRSSQETCEPSPGTSPKARTSKTPPSDSLALRGGVDLVHHRLAGLGVEAAHRRLVDALEVRRRQVASRSGARGRADLGHVARTRSRPSARRNALASAAGGHAGGRLARAGALEHVAHVGVAVLLHAGQVGVAGARKVDLVDLRRRPARGSSAPPSWRSRGCRSAGPPGCRACARGAPRRSRRRGPSRSSCARRGRGRAGAGPCRGRGPQGAARARPGSPSTIAVRPGPCDSPAVMKRKDMAPTPYLRRVRAPVLEGP